MIESVLVTVCDNTGFSVDLDIPAQERWDAIMPKLLEILSLLESDKFPRDREYLFSCNNKKISEGCSLAESGIWDGSYIQVYQI